MGRISILFHWKLFRSFYYVYAATMFQASSVYWGYNNDGYKGGPCFHRLLLPTLSPVPSQDYQISAMQMDKTGWCHSDWVIQLFISRTGKPLMKWHLKPGFEWHTWFSITYQKEERSRLEEQLVLMPSDRCKLGIFGRLRVANFSQCIVWGGARRLRSKGVSGNTL